MSRSRAWRRSQNERVFAKRRRMVNGWIRSSIDSSKTPETYFSRPAFLYILRDTPKGCSSLAHGCGHLRIVCGPPVQEIRERGRGAGWEEIIDLR